MIGWLSHPMPYTLVLPALMKESLMSVGRAVPAAAAAAVEAKVL